MKEIPLDRLILFHIGSLNRMRQQSSLLEPLGTCRNLYALMLKKLERFAAEKEIPELEIYAGKLKKEHPYGLPSKKTKSSWWVLGFCMVVLTGTTLFILLINHYLPEKIALVVFALVYTYVTLRSYFTEKKNEPDLDKIIARLEETYAFVKRME